MRSTLVAGAFAVALAACSNPAPKPEGTRFRIEQLGPASVQLWPNAGQLPYCLAFTASDKGVVRMLTLSNQNTAIKCEPGQPIGEVAYRIPPEEGHVRILVVFADQAVDATAIAAQVREITFKQRRVSGMDLRAPGSVAVDTIDFTPSP